MSWSDFEQTKTTVCFLRMWILSVQELVKPSKAEMDKFN